MLEQEWLTCTHTLHMPRMSACNAWRQCSRSTHRTNTGLPALILHIRPAFARHDGRHVVAQLAGVNIREPEMLERYEAKYGKAVNTLASSQGSQSGLGSADKKKG